MLSVFCKRISISSRTFPFLWENAEIFFSNSIWGSKTSSSSSLLTRKPAFSLTVSRVSPSLKAIVDIHHFQLSINDVLNSFNTCIFKKNNGKLFLPVNCSGHHGINIRSKRMTHSFNEKTNNVKSILRHLAMIIVNVNVLNLIMVAFNNTYFQNFMILITI